MLIIIYKKKYDNIYTCTQFYLIFFKILRNKTECLGIVGIDVKTIKIIIAHASVYWLDFPFCARELLAREPSAHKTNKKLTNKRWVDVRRT